MWVLCIFIVGSTTNLILIFGCMLFNAYYVVIVSGDNFDYFAGNNNSSNIVCYRRVPSIGCCCQTRPWQSCRYWSCQFLNLSFLFACGWCCSYWSYKRELMRLWYFSCLLIVSLFGDNAGIWILALN